MKQLLKKTAILVLAAVTAFMPLEHEKAAVISNITKRLF